MSDLVAVVCKAVAEVQRQYGSVTPPVGPDASLIDTIGLDSIRFVDLTVELESALGVREFPMQDWVDAQRKDQGRFLVRDLARECERLLEEQGYA